MKKKSFLSSYKFAMDSGRTIFISNAVLAVLLSFSLYVNFSSDSVIVHKMNPYCEDVSIGFSTIDNKSQQRLSLFIASAMGSVTPENESFQRSVVLDYASPVIYKKVKDLMDFSFDELKKEKISISFTPEKVYTEFDGVTYVTGSTSIVGATGIKKRTVRTYEFKWSVQSYSPTFDFVNVYDAPPKDFKWRTLQESNKESR